MLDYGKIANSFQDLEGDRMLPGGQCLRRNPPELKIHFDSIIAQQDQRYT